jgi:hypothetical protein
MRTEAAAAHADAVVVRQRGSDAVVVEPLDAERHHADLVRPVERLRTVDRETGDLGEPRALDFDFRLRLRDERLDLALRLGDQRALAGLRFGNPASALGDRPTTSSAVTASAVPPPTWSGVGASAPATDERACRTVRSWRGSATKSGAGSSWAHVDGAVAGELGLSTAMIRRPRPRQGVDRRHDTVTFDAAVTANARCDRHAAEQFVENLLRPANHPPARDCRPSRKRHGGRSSGPQHGGDDDRVGPGAASGRAR